MFTCTHTHTNVPFSVDGVSVQFTPFAQVVQFIGLSELYNLYNCTVCTLTHTS